MTLEDVYKEIKDLMDVYGEDCPVKSFSRLRNVNQILHIWYDEDEDAVLIS